MSFNTLSRIGPYVNVQGDYIKQFKNGRKFRIAIYGAFDAYGLIGSEKNGILVLDENNKQVLCDEICKADSGYFGATEQQRCAYFKLKMMKWPKFQQFINDHERSRYAI